MMSGGAKVASSAPAMGRKDTRRSAATVLYRITPRPAAQKQCACDGTFLFCSIHHQPAMPPKARVTSTADAFRRLTTEDLEGEDVHIPSDASGEEADENIAVTSPSKAKGKSKAVQVESEGEDSERESDAEEEGDEFPVMTSAQDGMRDLCEYPGRDRVLMRQMIVSA